jgi:hypothetical protein
MARSQGVQLGRRTAAQRRCGLAALGGPSLKVLLGVLLGAFALAAVILLPLLARATVPAMPTVPGVPVATPSPPISLPGPVRQPAPPPARPPAHACDWVVIGLPGPSLPYLPLMPHYAGRLRRGCRSWTGVATGSPFT